MFNLIVENGKCSDPINAVFEVLVTTTFLLEIRLALDPSNGTELIILPENNNNVPDLFQL